MSQRGQQSIAHEYDERNECKYCGTYKVNVEKMSLDCTPAREALADSGQLQEKTDGK